MSVVSSTRPNARLIWTSVKRQAESTFSIMQMMLLIAGLWVPEPHWEGVRTRSVPIKRYQISTIYALFNRFSAQGQN